MSQTGAELVVAGANAFAAEKWTPAKVELLGRTLAPGLSVDQMSLYLGMCDAVGLNPLRKEIYGIVREGKLTIQTGIDGYRKIALRTGEYRGQIGPYWCGDDGEWKDVWVSTDPPVAAKIGVLRDGFKEPLYAVALYREYVQKKRNGDVTSMWVNMPANQLAKCAEALAIRKAFPDDVAGVYTNEEMAQAGNDEFEIVDAVEPIAVLREAWRQVQGLYESKEIGNARCIDLLKSEYGEAADVKDMSDDERIEFAALLTQEYTRQLSAKQPGADAPSSCEPELAEFEEVTVTVDDDPLGGMDSPRIQIPVTGRKGDAYLVTVFNDGSWNCSCPARTPDCHHVTDIRRPYPGGVGYLWPGDAEYDNAPPSDASVPETPADVSTHTPETGLLAYAKKLGIRDTDAMMEILKVPGGPEDMPACIAALDALAASRNAAAEEAGEAA